MIFHKNISLIATVLFFLVVIILGPIGQMVFAKDAAPKPKKKEVFGFAPYWNFDKLDGVDFSVLTTLAYFDIPVDATGDFDIYSAGYQTFESDAATKLFDKAKNSGTRVVVTLTQMDNYSIEMLVSNKKSQEKLIKNTVNLVSDRGLKGVNIDFEYSGNPGQEIRDKFSQFVSDTCSAFHKKIPDSQVTVSVYASAAKDDNIHDLGKISKVSDGIFMMAYDFATYGADNAQPTAPLYGHKEGKYWYDISTAVSDFLTKMPASKLILGLPWYGYDYPVDQPEVLAATQKGYYYYYWYGRRRYTAYWQPETKVMVYADAQDDIDADQTGWDDLGKVNWKAYQEDGSWRMLFFDDCKSLKVKYDFAKQKGLGGVGIWALGFENGKTELWTLLKNEFGIKLTQTSPSNPKS